jgi:pyridoxine 5-phosphate synthase
MPRQHDNQQFLLCLNIDHIATLRQVRLASKPSVIEAAELAEKSGAHGITVHLREDRRHIQDQDVYELKKVVKGRYTLEMAMSEEIFLIAKEVKPDLITLVPEKREELTTEGGLDVKGNKKAVRDFIERAKDNSLQVSLFIEPDLETIKIAKEIGAERIELHTGKFADSKNKKTEIEKLLKAAELAHSLGFVVNAGHGLSTENVKEILYIPNLKELHIGHSIVARAVIVGLEKAVKEILDAIKNG